jgi:hypothetical protein
LDIFGQNVDNLATFDGSVTSFPFGFNNPDDPDGERVYGSESPGETDNTTYTVSTVGTSEATTPATDGKKRLVRRL